MAELLAAGADVQARTKASRRYVLMCCARFTADSEGSTWIEQGGFTALHFAARSGDVDSAQLLMRHGAQLEALSAAKTTALVIAAQQGNTPAVRALLAGGANANAAEAGYPHFHWAAVRGNGEMVAVILAHKADPNARLKSATFQKEDNGGEYAFDKFLIGATPFALATRRGALDVMQLLSESGADVRIPLADGRSPLMLAAEGKSTGMVRLRLSQETLNKAVDLALQLGVAVNARDAEGNTALHVAARSRFNRIIELLAERGADLSARNIYALTPLGLALSAPENPAGGR